MDGSFVNPEIAILKTDLQIRCQVILGPPHPSVLDPSRNVFVETTPGLEVLVLSRHPTREAQAQSIRTGRCGGRS